MMRRLVLALVCVVLGAGMPRVATALTAHERALAAARPGLIRYPEYQDIDRTVYDTWLHGLIPPTQPHYVPGASIPAGSLLLNMLVKDERQHLSRTLPRWAPIIDGWIIGVDVNNTDDSVAVIESVLGHIPGHVVLVEFSGMGPTWSVLVKEGLHAYPTVTHGVLADADFSPVIGHAGHPLRKSELDVRCSKHMYTIVNEDRTNSRLMDWVYRNIAYVNVTRRTHQTLNAPVLPNQEVFQTLLSLTIEERDGGYGDRSGNKDLRYIAMLEADLLDYPNDPRTIYYLAIAHLNLALRATTPKESVHMTKAIEYFDQRAALTNGNSEERWFAVLKLAEIHERYLWDHSRSLHYYDRAIELDYDRADGHFYAGQRHRLNGQPLLALPYLLTAASLTEPQRSLFQWHLLYTCLSKLEYGEAVLLLGDADSSTSVIDRALTFAKNADCQADGTKLERQKEIIAALKTKKAKRKSKPVSTSAPVSGSVSGSQRVSVDANDSNRRLTMLQSVVDWNDALSPSFRSALRTERLTELEQHLQSMKSTISGSESGMSCRAYRTTSLQYLKWVKNHEHEIRDVIDASDAVLPSEWQSLHEAMRSECR